MSIHARHKLNRFLASMSDSRLVLNERDSCSFKCTNGMRCIVELIPNSTAVLVYFPLKRLPDSLATRVATLEQALSMNLSLQQSNGATIVLDERLKQLTLSAQRELETCSFEEFDSWLGKLIQRSQRAQEELDRFELPKALKAKSKGPSVSPLNQAIQNSVLLKI
ncbi:MAG: type III secretion system chaperone [Oleiphilaceae bacterium]|nr:type III secretion system chaperone [Oleiphilaceae bacterium]